VKPNTNGQGLTLGEWLVAANLGRRTWSLAEEARQRKAWRAGEDPTEWAAQARKR